MFHVEHPFFLSFAGVDYMTIVHQLCLSSVRPYWMSCNTFTSAGETPGIREACPIVAGRIRVSFSGGCECVAGEIRSVKYRVMQFNRYVPKFDNRFWMYLSFVDAD